jgi:hypothetical protein
MILQAENSSPHEDGTHNPDPSLGHDDGHGFHDLEGCQRNGTEPAGKIEKVS